MRDRWGGGCESRTARPRVPIAWDLPCSQRVDFEAPKVEGTKAGAAHSSGTSSRLERDSAQFSDSRHASIASARAARGGVVGHVRLQRRHRDVAVVHRLEVRPIVRLPVVLPFLDPVVGLAARIAALVHDRDVIALALHREPEPLRLPRRHVEAEERPRREAVAQDERRDRRCGRGGAGRSRRCPACAPATLRSPARRAARLPSRPTPSPNTSRRRRG